MKKPIQLFAIILVLTLNSCASSYDYIEPNALSYNSNSSTDTFVLEYKYDLLNKKYAKKEANRGMKLIAIKVTNNSNKDVVFGKDITLKYKNGVGLNLLETEKVFKDLKQATPLYLLYLLLTPVNFTSTSNGRTTSSVPIGLGLGPATAGGNMIVAGSANKKLKKELMEFDILGTLIKSGETKTGLIGIRADNYDSIEIVPLNNN